MIEPVKTYKCTYGCTLRINPAPTSMRERVGRALRSLAQMSDGMLSLGVEMDSNPSISFAEKKEILDKGFEQMRQNLEEYARQAAVEQVLRAADPELFEDEACSHSDERPTPR